MDAADVLTVLDCAFGGSPLRRILPVRELAYPGVALGCSHSEVQIPDAGYALLVTHPFPPGFFSRADESPDTAFYTGPRFVTHIDDGAIAAVGGLYAELALGPRVLDLCSSWVSHFLTPPTNLTVLGLNTAELAANADARARVTQDLNVDPGLPFSDGAFDDAVCCVSVDYLTRAVEVFGEVARVVRPGGRFVCTWSNRCFPTKAIRGWLASSDDQHLDIVAAYFAASGNWGTSVRRTVIGPVGRGDPLWACWAVRAGDAKDS